MKFCSYCGRENDEAFLRCRECGTDLSPETTPVVEQEEPATPRFADYADVPGAFSFEEGFSRPDWEVIGKVIEALAEVENRRLAWDDAVLQWTTRLSNELGGGYKVTNSGRCVLVSNLEPEAAERLLRFAESAIIKIKEYLTGVAWRNFNGLHVILVFGEDDDYCQYLSWFYQDGVHPANVGVQLHKGFPHIACFYQNEPTTAQVLAHELVHHSISDLPVPHWLHEGLAMTIERIMGSRRSQMLSEDRPERHHRFWDEKSIQRFWAGTSFDEPGESVELSYDLAEVLFHLLATDRKDFLAFIKAADYHDAGQTAALDNLGTCLGEAVGTFLGPGNWRPQRKAIKESWEAKRNVAEVAQD